MSDEVLMTMAKAMDKARKRRGLGGPDLMAVGLRAALHKSGLSSAMQAAQGGYILEDTTLRRAAWRLLHAANLSEGEGDE